MAVLRELPTEFSFNQPQVMNGYHLLRSLADDSVDLVILDPEYRSVLDAMNYGNEGSRQKARAEQKETSDFMISRFVHEAGRVLKPSAHFCLWIDKFILGTGQHVKFMEFAVSCQVVDILHWNKLKPGMGRRTRYKSEYVIIAQKKPIQTKGVWKDRSFADCYSELPQKWRHAHAKPIGLTKRLIEAMTDPGAIVVDPCAGGYGVLEACKATGRTFLGCDLVGWDQSR